ncbi:MAG: flavin reductase family protein, partial [Acidimicrobiales bacterium]
MSEDALDDLVVAMDGAMVVVTVSADGEAGGCLVGFHSQCSIDPPRYAVWLSVANRTCELARRATHLAVHVLGDDDLDLARLFGGMSTDVVDKLAAVDWQPGPGGVPLLARCPSRLVGPITDRHADGDHVAHIIEVVDAGFDGLAA